MSPENFKVHLNGGYDPVKNDLFSLGVILFAMSFKSALWSRPSEPSDRNIVFRRLRDKGAQFMLETHPASKALMEEGETLFSDLLDRLLAVDPT